MPSPSEAPDLPPLFAAAVARVLADFHTAAEEQRRSELRLASEQVSLSAAFDSLKLSLSKLALQSGADFDIEAKDRGVRISRQRPEQLSPDAGEPPGPDESVVYDSELVDFPPSEPMAFDSEVLDMFDKDGPEGQHYAWRTPNIWPANLELREGLAVGNLRTEVTANGQHWVSVATPRATTDGSLSGSMKSSRSPMLGKRVEEAMQPFIIHPNSTCRMSIDVASCLLLMYDMFLTPYILAWDTPFEGWLMVVGWFTLSFWTLDLSWSFLTGFYSHGELEMRPFMIVQHYLRSYFPLDMAIVVSDWASTVFAATMTGTSKNTASVKIVRLAKATRLLRIVAVLRVVRISGVLEDVMESSVSDTIRLFLHICKLLFGILWLNHVVGCAWYAIGKHGSSDTGLHWTSALTGDGPTFDELSLAYQYVTTFHWSMIQLANGSMEVLPQNTSERIFTIGCLVVGVVIGCSLVSSISASVMQAQTLRQSHNEKVAALRHYLRQHAIDQKVAVRVLRQYNDRTGVRSLLTEKDVPALEILSSSLRAELRCQIFCPLLQSHPLFRLWFKVHPPALHKVCWVAVRSELLLPTDILFSYNSEAECAYMVVTGSLEYRQNASSGDSNILKYVSEDPRTQIQEETVAVGSGDILCEAALWSCWQHVGELECVTKAQIIAVSATQLLEVMNLNPVVREITMEYARMFHARVVSSKPLAAQWPSDIHVPLTDYSEIVSQMSPELRQVIGQLALESSPLSHSRVEKLTAEVLDGTATVVQDGAGEVLRIISVSTLSITRDGDDCVLVCLGRMLQGHAKPNGKLPGTKQKAGELPSSAVGRILATELAPMWPMLQFTNASREVVTEKSKQLGVRTKYVRTVQHARLTSTRAAIGKRHVGVTDSETPSTPSSTRGAAIRSRTILESVLIGEDIPGFRQSVRRSLHSARSSSRSMAFETASMQEVHIEYEVLVIRSEDGEEAFYAWLPRNVVADISRVKDPRVDALLRRWLLYLESEHQKGRVLTLPPSAGVGAHLPDVSERSDSPQPSSRGSEGGSILGPLRLQVGEDDPPCADAVLAPSGSPPSTYEAEAALCVVTVCHK